MVPIPQLQLGKLFLSSKQESKPNPKAEPYGWKELYFWTEGLLVLHQAGRIFNFVKKLAPEAQAEFWRGSVPAQLRDILPPGESALISDEVLKGCQAWKSQEIAFWRLV